MSAPLTAKTNQHCINVSASNVVLNLHGFATTRNCRRSELGHSGINVSGGKRFVVVEGANDFIEALGVGIEDQGSYATIQDVNTVNSAPTGVGLNGGKNDLSFSQVTSIDPFVANPAAIARIYGVQVFNAYSAGAGDGVLQAVAIYGLWFIASNAARYGTCSLNSQRTICLGCSTNRL